MYRRQRYESVWPRRLYRRLLNSADPINHCIIQPIKTFSRRQLSRLPDRSSVRNPRQDLLAPVEVTVFLTVEASQSEVQELRLTADYRREVQSIIVKAFADRGSASSPASEVAEQQLLTVEVWVRISLTGRAKNSCPGHATHLPGAALILRLILHAIFRNVWSGLKND